MSVADSDSSSDCGADALVGSPVCDASLVLVPVVPGDVDVGSEDGGGREGGGSEGGGSDGSEVSVGVGSGGGVGVDGGPGGGPEEGGGPEVGPGVSGVEPGASGDDPGGSGVVLTASPVVDVGSFVVEPLSSLDDSGGAGGCGNALLLKPVLGVVVMAGGAGPAEDSVCWLASATVAAVAKPVATARPEAPSAATRRPIRSRPCIGSIGLPLVRPEGRHGAWPTGLLRAGQVTRNRRTR